MFDRWMQRTQAWPTVFPTVYLAHLLDERLWPPGTANWVTANTSLHFTNSAWLWVNLVSLAAMIVVSVLLARGVLPRSSEVAISTHIGLHGATRVLGTIFSLSIAPGVVTGVLLCLPLSVPLLLHGWKSLPRRSFVLALVAPVTQYTRARALSSARKQISRLPGTHWIAEPSAVTSSGRVIFWVCVLVSPSNSATNSSPGYPSKSIRNASASPSSLHASPMSHPKGEGACSRHRPSSSVVIDPLARRQISTSE